MLNLNRHTCIATLHLCQGLHIYETFVIKTRCFYFAGLLNHSYNVITGIHKLSEIIKNNGTFINLF